MLKREQLDDVLSAMRVTELVAGATERSKRNYIVQQVEKIRAGLNPHPAGQKEENVPKFHGFDVDGCQHKYRETVLFFPHEVCACSSIFAMGNKEFIRDNSVIPIVHTASGGHSSLLSVPSSSSNPTTKTLFKDT